MICTEGNESLADDFLMSMMIQSHRVGNHDGDGDLAFIVPGFKDEGECRKFRICREQFRNLFGLAKLALARLETRWKRGLSIKEVCVFGWSPCLLSYKVGKKLYMVVSFDE